MIGIYRISDGVLLRVVADSDAASRENMAGCATTAAPTDYASGLYDFTGGAFVEATARIRPLLLAGIDAENERRQMAMLTAGGAKKWVYAAKAAEVHDYRNVIGAALATLTAAEKTARFPFASAEAADSGDSLATVIARYEAGIAASRATVAQIEAIAQRAKRGVRAAATAAAMRSAATISWG